MFGGGGMGGGPGGQKKPSPFKESTVFTLDIGNVSKFYNRKEVWVIYFYKAGQREKKKVLEEYMAVAEKLSGIIKVAAMDCVAEEELCEEFGARQLPSLMIYNENKGEAGVKYKGKMEQGPIAGAASKRMQSFVDSVTEKNYDWFVYREVAEKHKVLLFTDKKSTPAIFKALSKKYEKEMLFGMVEESETGLIEKFKVTSFPTIMVLTDPEAHTGDIYKGELKIEKLQRFMITYAKNKPKIVVKPEF